MRSYFASFYIGFFSFLFCQEVIYSENLSPKKITPGSVLADLGDDITASSLTTVILDGSRSQPQNGSLTYEWLFPPNMIGSDDYNFSDNDTPVFYDKDQKGNQSVRSLTTRDKFIEFDVPNLPGQAYEVVLRVQNHVGTTHRDTLIITIEQPLSMESTDTFSGLDINSEDTLAIDESTNLREPLVATLIHRNLITIQPIHKKDLNSMQVNLINKNIYAFLKERGMKHVLDPNRIIPKKISVNKPYSFTRIENDTIAIAYLDTVSSGEDLSRFSVDPVDTVFKAFTTNDSSTTKKTYYVFREYKDEFTTDTLTYTEIVDTTLSYNFNCENYDCAAENAYLERANRVLSWGINQYDQLEFHYFTLNDIYSSQPVNEWIAHPVKFSPAADSLLRYPEHISFDSTGSAILVSGNKQDIFNVGKNVNPSSMIKNLPEGNSIEHPSGVCVGRLGELYITDQSNHSVFWVFEGVASAIYSAPRYKNGDLISGEPTIPTSIRLNSLEEIIVLFLGDGSVRKFDRKGVQSVLLQSGVIKNPSDIALNDEDDLFVVSALDKKVYKVVNDDEVIVIAGNDNISAVALDGIMATESSLGAPVSIDFDISNRLYIADNLFGSIRVVTPDGIIGTLTDKGNRIFDIGQLRVNNHKLTTLYTTHSLQHKITRVRFQNIAPKSKLAFVEYPYYTLEKEGVYGLEHSVKLAVENVLMGVVPKEKTSLFSKVSSGGSRMSTYIKKRPIIFGLLLILLNQGISDLLTEEVQDLPPDNPF
ncbi:MAG: hypothetical protein ACJZ10_01690 [Candidatus Neomarinimicrobiota bacterium]